jgi:AAA domain
VPARYLYLSEQGNNFAQALKESGLADHSGHVRIVQFKDVSAKQWDTLINQAAAEAHRRGLDVLVVDTFAVFAKLKGSEENEAGPVADRMRVLRGVAQKYDLAVLLIRHAGKDGTARGSSAFEAEADICVSLSRPEGRHTPNVRKLTVIGRYGEWERNVELKDGRYVSLGTDDNIEFKNAVRFVRATLPESPDAGMRKQELKEKRTESDGGFSVKTLERALDWLVRQEEVGEKQLMNERGKPKVYWLASYKPPGGEDEGI